MMNAPPSPDTVLYFASPDGHFWGWEDDGAHQAAVWAPDGATIVFREELQPLLAACAPADLPPLGALLLVVAAACDSYDEARTNDRLLTAFKRFNSGGLLPAILDSPWSQVAAGLSAVRQLPARLRESGPPRWRLCRTLFADATEDWAGPAAATIVARVLREFEGAPSVSTFRQSEDHLTGLSRLRRELAALALAFQRCPPETLRNRLETGVDAIPEIPDDSALSEWVPEQADLLAELEGEGGELAHVASMARRLGAVLHLPHPAGRCDDLPQGGVSDLTNRGDPSRLLLTELASDDVMFAVRLAHGEALYLRRESPPATPPPQRTLLLDTGIFLWGMPRLLALAAVLALLRKNAGAPHAATRVLLLGQESALAIRIDSAEAVRECLRALNSAPHPAEALRELLDDPAALAAPGHTLVLVTHASALALLAKEPVWSRLLDQSPVLTLVVDRHGNFELSRHTRAGGRPLSRLHVDPDDLLGPEAGPLTGDSGWLPRFYLERPWPLCYPVLPCEGQAFAVGTRGIVGITPTGCACWWPSGMGAGRVLSPGPHPNALARVAMETSQSDTIFLLFEKGQSNSRRILVLSLTGAQEPSTLLLPERIRGISQLRVQSGALVVTSKAGVMALGLEDGRLLGSTQFSMGRTPWFDGESFQPFGSIELAPNADCSRLRRLPGPAIKRNHITQLAEAGFGKTGGLVIASPHGRTYKLAIASGELVWDLADPNSEPLRPLAPAGASRAEHRALTEARFPDGRRIVHDPRGWIHVCEPKTGAELTVALVRGRTAAWSFFGLHFGDPVLHRDSRPGAHDVLDRLAATLLRPLKAGRTARSH